jgi:RNA polymerase sigma-70 factor, ECF subfamily
MFWNSDSRLAQKAVSGDQRALEALLGKHRPRVAGMLRRLTGNGAEAEDLLQETMLIACQRLGDWQGRGALSTWLCGIAVRQYGTLRRQQHAAPTVPFEDAFEPIAPHQSSDPFAQLSQREAEHALEAAIAALPEHYRVVFVLIRVDGLAYKEAAAALEIPLGTVQSRLGMASRLLFAKLSPLIIEGTFYAI